MQFESSFSAFFNYTTMFQFFSFFPSLKLHRLRVYSYGKQLYSVQITGYFPCYIYTRIYPINLKSEYIVRASYATKLV